MSLKGKRPSGKQKKKSIKANVTSKFSSSRKLSRMGKKVKKGKAGPGTEFVTRSYALKKLQISLKDFRRLCILKGIYPRVPNKPPKGADKVYYDIKDLSYLAHEPLLAKFREFKTFMRKVRNAAGRNQTAEARRKNDMKPLMILDHLVKERYPRFIDALGDLDDALCMIHLFAALPSAGRITADKTTNCQQLVSYWQYFVARSRSLRKVFVSVKGVYYQAEIMGEVVTWLTPHSFTQRLPKGVDFRVMITFLDFYEVFFKFVLFKLYCTLELPYPPTVNDAMRDCGGFLLSVNSKTVTNGDEAVGSEVDKVKSQRHKDGKKLGRDKIRKLEEKLTMLEKEDEEDEEEDEDDAEEQEDDVDIAGPLTEAFAGFQDSLTSLKNDGDGIDAEDRKVFTDDARVLNESSSGKAESNTNLFQGLCFFVSREVPLEILQICIISFGGLLGWESDTGASPIQRNDPRITHQIVDRPKLPSDEIITSREYIQPQWVFDSLNAQLLLPVHRYRMGAVLPPHLSPFVDDDKEGYLPTYREELKKLKSTVEVRGGSGKATQSNVEEQREEESEEDEAEQYARELEAEKSGVSFSAHQQEQLEESDEEESEDEEGDEEEDEESSDEEQEEVEEVTPTLQRKGPKGIVYDPSAGKKAKSQEEEEAALSHIMMSKKTQRLYGRMKHGVQKKRDSIDRLVEKRKALESAAEDHPGKKPSKKSRG